MCAGCMGTADFLLTGGVLGAASLKVAGRRLVPGWRGRGKVTDAEAEAFVARMRASSVDDAPEGGDRTGSRPQGDPAEPALAGPAAQDGPPVPV